MTDDDPSVLSSHDEWRVVRNRFTTSSEHVLIVPKRCWSTWCVQDLGGVFEVLRVLRIIMGRLLGTRAYHAGIQIGNLAGQTLGHFHWHFDAHEASADFHHAEMLAELRRAPIFESTHFLVGAGGFFAGQCCGVPFFHGDEFNVEELAQCVFRLVELGNRRFKSVQGLPPDYRLTFFFSDRRFDFFSYEPILVSVGINQSVGLWTRAPFKLYWPHEITARHLAVT